MLTRCSGGHGRVRWPVLLAAAGALLMGLAGAGLLIARNRLLGFSHEGFEGALALRAWRMDTAGHGMARGTLALTADAARSGKRGLRLGYDFRSGGLHVVATGPPPRCPDLRGFRFWVRNPDGCPLAIRVRDQAGHVFQRAFRTGTDRWEQVEIIFGIWDECWDGPPDRRFHYPPRRIALLAARGNRQVGEVHIDDLEAVGWREIASRAGWYTLSLASSPADAARLTRFRGDVEIKGRPLKLRVRVAGASEGSRCFARIGSIWTEFTTTAPIRRCPDGLACEFQVTELGTWRWEGFLADGLASLPLRLKELRVVRGDSDAADDRATIAAVEAQTLTPAHASIELLASGSRGNASDAWTCAMTNTTGRRVSGTLAWTIRDWHGRPIASGSRPAVLQPGSCTTHRITLPSGSDACRSAEFVLAAEGREYGPAAAAIVIPAPPVRRGPPTPRWGIGTGLAFLPAGKEHDAVRRKRALLAAQAGVRFGRELMFWDWSEPRRGEYRWERFDAAVNALLEQGITPYGIIGYWAPWTKPYTLEGIRDYAGYCRALVKHFRGRVRHWELWNEPNGGFWLGPKSLYGDLVKAAYSAIKEADPNAFVLAGSACPMDPAFLRMVAATGVPYEAVSVHPYGPDLRGGNLDALLRAAAEASALPGRRARRLWVTETGFAAIPGSASTLEEQAAVLARTYITALGPGGAEHVAWVRMPAGPSPTDADEQLGILEHGSLAPRPAYRALQTISAEIGDGRYVGRDVGPDGVTALRFRRADHDCLVLWAVEDARVVRLSWKQAPPVVVDLMGRPIPRGNQPWTATLALPRGEPILLRTAAGDVRVDATVLRVRWPEAILPGDTAALRVEAEEPLHGTQITAHGPAGWRLAVDPSDGVVRSYDLTVPRGAGPGVRTVVFELRLDGASYSLPVRLVIHPPTMLL
ncbi:MAG: hypothetical protein GX446_13780 [Chthonomonadales bacterium]|nr:hypothetical protein [Chthonomonadales bacterium]